PVASYVERVRAAEALVLSFPVWNFGYPAILKGFFDRVFLPGVSFRMVEGKVEPCLHNITKVATVTTYGGPRWRAMVMGDPPRRLVKRLLRATVKPGAPFPYLAHYDMNRCTEATLERFKVKVAQAMDRF
ncbi:MAG: NAD(P)H-dependent oxidoreductase, partial [Mesorhizobium sp.]|nr:NAD(P)H-dependent oxidoreductase [Mesorhizobium sp.]